MGNLAGRPLREDGVSSYLHKIIAEHRPAVDQEFSDETLRKIIGTNAGETPEKVEN